MKQHKSEHSPIVYYISGKTHNEWVLFLHAAFVNHKMFQAQIDYFKNKYNVLAVDIIGHGQSTRPRKGDAIDKMSPLSAFHWAPFWRRTLLTIIPRRSNRLPVSADMTSTTLMRKCRKKTARRKCL